MAGEIKLNNVSIATENAGTVTIAPNNVQFAANHAGIKTALNASGSAPISACRAWVNFNAIGTFAIRGSMNVSSLNDNGTGLYRIYFTTNMPDVNYSCVATGGASGNRGNSINVVNMAVELVEFTDGIDAAYYDSTYVNVAVFR